MTIDLPKNLSLYTLPEKIEFTLFMIREELKNRKFVSSLEQVGFDGSPCTTDFGSVVLSAFGIDEPSDEEFTLYNELVEQHCNYFQYGDAEGLKEQTFNLYIEIEILKRRNLNPACSR